MKSKAVVLACLLLFVSVLALASAVSEGNQEQHANAEVGKANPIEDSKQRCHHGCCRFSGHRCVKCCRSVAEAQTNTNNAQQEFEVEGWKGGSGHGGWKGGSGHGGKGGGGK